MTTNPKVMYADVVVGGKYGLHGYSEELVMYILDAMPLVEPHHREFYQLFSKTSRSLARKVVNYFKDGRHKSASASNDGAENSKEEQGPRTRSKRNAKTLKCRIPANENTDTDSSDDMTNTDSLESRWYWRVEEDQPDIKFRRASRHPGVANEETRKRTKGATGAKRGKPRSAAGSSMSNHGPKPKPKPRP
ncbi:hypothetical protein ARMGADRAFT_605824 [Armillaria gallica]|uniref:Uncharacterized protein n=1 Tax=Armillaria gallica TaxID=47427 RepID=A0A2H3D1B0_ARMGA|nr:hypothetical protein ARMGADRAFT_605824 [Armillaria gallica]